MLERTYIPWVFYHFLSSLKKLNKKVSQCQCRSLSMSSYHRHHHQHHYGLLFNALLCALGDHPWQGLPDPAGQEFLLLKMVMMIVDQQFWFLRSWQAYVVQGNSLASLVFSFFYSTQWHNSHWEDWCCKATVQLQLAQLREAIVQKIQEFYAILS